MSNKNNIDFLPFNVLKAELAGSNLIEASAGTGKTYSIAIMVLRLILEKRIAIEKILMVTFTKAAVAELEERIRLFVRRAYKVSSGEGINDETISKLVTDAVTRYGEEDVQQLLKKGVLFLDETSVLTIHGFCQQTLTEFAFETNQLFGAETLQDSGSVLTDEVNKFWRQNITGLPTELLQFLITSGLSRRSIQQVVQEHLNGKKYLYYKHDKSYQFCEEDQQKILNELKELNRKVEELAEAFYSYIQDNKPELIARIKSNGRAKKFDLELLDDPAKLKSVIVGKRETGYIADIFEDALTHCDSCDEAESEVTAKAKEIITDINCQAINSVLKGLEEYKQRNNMLSFEDMIVNLHKAITRKDNERLVSALRKKYEAVFIDEFQDTDKLQYEIFSTAFGKDTILFYIGDPKQSIYAWRKADIHTYFKAYKDVDNKYGMNENFRSSERMIQAMNKFFLPEDSFETFAFEPEAGDKIVYRKVDSPANNTKGDLYCGDEPVVPITISLHDNQTSICDAAAAQVIDLFSEKKYFINKQGEREKITPAHIGILVWRNKQAQIIKDTLASYGIPAVTINDNKILCTDEAKDILYLLEAIAAPSGAAIHKALLSPFTGYRAEQILQLDDELTIALFRKFKSTWENEGVYSALTQFSVDYNVRKVLLQHNTEHGERIITNFFQLMELVHKVQNDKQYSPAELISWLKRGIEGMETEGDEYEQRVESDEEAIKIVTIHRSKGLEYKIVLAPFLDFVTDSKHPIGAFRNEEGEYVSGFKEDFDEQQSSMMTTQLEQEYRRLLYVAITRAVYKCFIFKNNYFKNSTVTGFIEKCTVDSDGLISICPALSIPEGYRYNKQHVWQPVKQDHEVKFELLQKNWIRMSYTRLSGHSHTQRVINRTVANANHFDVYDDFMLHKLAKGTHTGNMLHYIFENISFSDSLRHQYITNNAIERYGSKKDNYKERLHEMLQHVLNAPIIIGGSQFTLAEVGDDRRLQELEFDFEVKPFNTFELSKLPTDGRTINVDKSEVEGVMNGKMDLFFECKGKYYILDWKSNYLGNALQDYNVGAMAEAMNNSNYHLQYFIYTLAAKKYLQSRLTNFDYELHFGGVIYMFIRGVRNTGTSGIYTARPTLSQMELLESILNADYTSRDKKGNKRISTEVVA